jgi:anti-anti-sigma factor
MSELAVLKLTRRGEVHIASLIGEVDFSNAVSLEDRIVAGTAGATAVVIDMTEVEFIDSAGVRLLDHLVEHYEPHTPVLVVVPDPGTVRFTLHMCGFCPELLAGSVDGALSSLTPA